MCVYIYIYIYIYIYMCVCVCVCVCLVLSHINYCRLFKAKAIFIHKNSSTSNNLV